MCPLGDKSANRSKNSAAGPQVLGERRHVRRQAREHEAAVAVDPRRRHEAHGRVIEGLALAVAHRHRRQPARHVERPAVVRADQLPAGAVRVVVRQQHAAVAAGVDEHVQQAGGIARQQHRLGAERGRLVAAGLRDFTLVTDVYPGSGEDLLHLDVEHARLDKRPAAHAVCLDQVGRSAA